MESINGAIQDYITQLSIGQIQKAYRGIMAFMAGLSTHLARNYRNYVTSALYFGYMDMTYFAFTPPDLKNRKLKIAIVYVHERGRFEIWLSGSNKRIQAQYIELLNHRNIGEYQLSQLTPGVDSIIESILVEKPDFDQPEELKILIEEQTIKFIDDMNSLLN